MHLNENHAPARIMVKRRITDILELIKEFQALHGGKFPTIRSPFPRPNGSWNAIDGALRRDAIVQCEHFVRLKVELRQRGLTPSLARLAPCYSAPHVGHRRFADILEIIRQSREQHRGRFPLRTDTFAVHSHADTWVAIDSALATGAIVECPLWIVHRDKMKRLGVKPSLASLNPSYQPVRRERRTIASIHAAIVAYMAEHAGKLPNQRAPFPTTLPADSWKAICKALCSEAVEHDADWIEFHARLDVSRQKPSLFTLIDRYRHELHGMFAQIQPVDATALSIPTRSVKSEQVVKKQIQFAALVAQLFHLPAATSAKVDAASSSRRLARNLMRAKR